MYDFIMSLLSEELLSQAEYIGGILYLPASALFEEILSLILPFCMLSLIMGGLFLAADLVRYLIQYAYRRFRHKIARGVFRG